MLQLAKKGQKAKKMTLQELHASQGTVPSCHGNTTHELSFACRKKKVNWYIDISIHHPQRRIWSLGRRRTGFTNSTYVWMGGYRVNGPAASADVNPYVHTYEDVNIRLLIYTHSFNKSIKRWWSVVQVLLDMR